MTRSISAALALALLSPLAACDRPESAGAIATVESQLARLERRYQAAKAIADLIIAVAAPGRAADLRAIEDRVEAAFAAARAATTFAQHTAELAKAEAAIAELSAPGH